MDFTAEDPRIEELARAAAALTGRSTTEAIVEALRSYLAEHGGRGEPAAPDPGDPAATAIREQQIVGLADQLAQVSREQRARVARDDLYGGAPQV